MPGDPIRIGVIAFGHDPGCAIKAGALARQYPDDTHVAWLVARIGT